MSTGLTSVKIIFFSKKKWKHWFKKQIATDSSHVILYFDRSRGGITRMSYSPLHRRVLVRSLLRWCSSPTAGEETLCCMCPHCVVNVFRQHATQTEWSSPPPAADRPVWLLQLRSSAQFLFSAPLPLGSSVKIRQVCAPSAYTYRSVGSLQ